MTPILSSSLLGWLRCFEAAARHRSFTQAAAELCVTQGAVSQQVKHLEEWLRRPLFIRAPRALVLTPEGERLHRVLNESFQAIESTLRRLRKSDEKTTIALSCSPSFAMRWLTPRLGDFFQEHPSVAVRVHGEFHALDRSRMARDGIDAAIRFDPGRYPDVNAEEFLGELLFPVASPSFIAVHPDIRAPRDLRGELLLHDASPWDGADELEEWNYWLQQAGVKLTDLHRGQRFNLSQLAISAAMAGQGIAMGRSALVLDDIATGRLVSLFSLRIPSQASYFFVSAREPLPEIAVLREWLIGEAAGFRLERERLLR